MLLILAGLACAANTPQPWAASWAAAAQDLAQVPALATGSKPALLRIEDATLRQRMQITLGGSRVRVRFSNLFGAEALRIGAASVSRSTGDDAVSPAALRRLRFGGRPGITLAPGAEAWSDPVALAVLPGQELAVSFELPGPTAATTVHRLPGESTALRPGRAALRARWPQALQADWNHVVTGVDVRPAGSARVVVAFGDSITAGAGLDARRGAASRYPDRLANRLRGAPDQPGAVAVVNAGIAGNRLLADGVGPSGLSRFERDVLNQSGVSHVLILIGINDIGFGAIGARPGGAVEPGTPDPVAEALARVMGLARARGVKVLLGTLTPFKGAAYWSAAAEARRQAVNRWIRGRQEVDAVVDFDAVLRDPADPAALAAPYDSGDHLHPSDAGYAAMADAVDLEELRE